MKILIINSDSPDYQSDCILHGFYSIFGDNVTHINESRYMYKEYGSENLRKIYGRGFTIFGNLDVYYNDNTDIENKICNKFFDIIIYSSIRRNKKYFDIVDEKYDKNKIIIIDGEDDNNIEFQYKKYIYFKRELIYEDKNIYPISFSIPKEKICDINIINKKKEMSVIIPNFNFKYIYDNELDYYNEYRESMFATTFKKGGWDCMRHYEILANACIPYFKELENCPHRIMHNFPKKQIIETNHLYESKSINYDEYFEKLYNLYMYTNYNLTTEKSAKYILDIIKNN